MAALSYVVLHIVCGAFLLKKTKQNKTLDSFFSKELLSWTSKRSPDIERVCCIISGPQVLSVSVSTESRFSVSSSETSALRAVMSLPANVK